MIHFTSLIQTDGRHMDRQTDLHIRHFTVRPVVRSFQTDKKNEATRRQVYSREPSTATLTLLWAA